MLRRLALTTLLVPTLAAAQSPVVGAWSGEIDGAGLVITFHVAQADGELSSTFDVPAQGAFGVATGETAFHADTLTITAPAIGGRYRGALANETITGTWSQGRARFPLVLTRAEAAALPQRDDTPQPPFPYREETVTIASVEGVVLAGTLTVPDWDGPFPGVVLVSGSGPQGRDSEVFGHRLFHVLADHLARRGLAVLRYDDRGVAESTGDHDAATTADFALDAAAVAEYMARRPEVSATGILGHSEGGIIGPLAADASEDVGFVVALAAPAVPGRDVARYQFGRVFDGASVAEEVRRTYDAAFERLLDVAAAEGADAAERAATAFRHAIEDLTDADRAASGLDDGVVDRLAVQSVTPWMRHFIAYDPAPMLRSLRVPTLAVFGGLDRQVSAEDNVPAMRAALAGAPDGSDVVVFEGLNHLFQPAATGNPSEYAQIASSYDPTMMDVVAEWILDHGSP